MAETAPLEAAEQFCDAVAARLGPRLTSAVVYGSVARGEAVPGVSDINVLLLFDDVDADVLRGCGEPARRWVESGNTAPLVLGREEWARASDAFAIEVLDMVDAHVLVRGEDPVAGSHVAPRHLRLQAEREIRGKQVQLREGMLLSAGRGDELGTLLLRALPSFTTYLRAVLRLAGTKVPGSTADVIREGSALIGAAPAALMQVWEHRRDRAPLRVELGDPIVTGYYEAVACLARWIDAIPEER
jgi:predicted nucleotidyltransferase